MYISLNKQATTTKTTITTITTMYGTLEGAMCDLIRSSNRMISQRILAATTCGNSIWAYYCALEQGIL